MTDQQVGNIVYLVQMDVQQLITAQRQVNARLDRLDSGFDNTTRSVNNTEKSMLSLSRVAALLASALSVQQVAKYAEAWTVVNNKLANSIKPHEELGDAVNRVFNLAQSTRTELDATASLYSRLERATRQAGTSTEDLAKLTTIINQAFIVSGATAQEAESAIIQLSQGLASGTLRGEEYNSVNEQGNRLIVALSESLGVGAGKLREMAFAGKLTTDVVVNGLLKQGDAIGKEFANTVITMGQAFSVASNNITRFVGESATIKSAYNAFNSSVVTTSENLRLLGDAVAIVAVAMGSRFAAALAISTAAKVKSTMATVQQSAADRQLAKDEMGAASAVQRRAVVEQEAAVKERQRAIATLVSIKATNASTVAEVAHAEAETASIRINLQQIQAEKALEIQRGRAQISEQGRIATATRMAQLRQAEVVLTQQLARAEATAVQARAAAIATANAKVASTDAVVTTTTRTLTVANDGLAASQARVAATSITMMSALRSVNAFLMPLGGIGGAIMIAAAGWYLYSQNQAEARKESIAFANTLPDVIAKLKEMNLAQAQGVRADTITSIKNQKEALNDLNNEISVLSGRYKDARAAEKNSAAGTWLNNDAKETAAELEIKLAQKIRDRDSAQRTIKSSTDALRLINIQVNQGIVDQMKAARDNAIALAEAEKKTSFLGQAQGFLAEKLGQSTTAMAKFNAESLKINWGGKEGDKLIKQAERRLALSKAEGKAKAELQATYDAEDAGVTDPKAIDKLKGVYAQTEANTQAKKDDKKATSEQNSEAKKAASQAESVAQKLSNLKQQTEQAADSTQELSREQAILAAKQSLGKGATQEQIALAGKYRAEIWDTAAALKARNAIPELKENADYASQKAQLDMLQGAKDAQGKLLISQEQYNQQSAKLEQDHITALAKIRAGQAVTPQQEAAAQVDPVQALANENAQKLALIKEFTAQKVITEQQGLALMNAANKEYDEQRTAAQWQLLSQQSLGYDMLTSAVDAFSGNASNALTGLITGSMSAEEAMRSLGSTMLNSVVNSLVQVGVEALKNFIIAQTIGAAGQTAAAAAATAGGAAALAAWTPAAIAASIATMGAASGTGLAAYQTAQAGGLAMSVLGGVAGARKNGGPVNAGSMYQVGEGGRPELLQAGGKQYMIPGDNGKVISNKDMQGGGIVVNNIVNNYSSAGYDTQSTVSSDGKTLTIESVIYDLNNGGSISQAITNNMNVRRTPRGQG
ncbi:tape measure protein [Serratia fonticola]